MTTEFFVSALARSVEGQGGYATVLRKGALEAGAVFIVLRLPNGEQVLYAPAMQLSYILDGPTERMFELRKQDLSDAEVTEIIEREARIDPDFWAVELEGNFNPLPFPIVEPSS